MANDGDAGKYEPGSEPVSRSGRFGQGIEATSPLPVGSTYAESEPWPRDGQGTLVNNGHSRARTGREYAAARPGCAAHSER